MNNSGLSGDTRKIELSQTVETHKGHWYLLTGLILGLILGIIFSWLIWPVQYENSLPRSLSEPYKAIYRVLIARAYAATGDLDRAISRLDLLKDEDSMLALGAQAQQALAQGQESEAYDLALLASAIQSDQASSDQQTPSIVPSPTTDSEIVPTQTLPSIDKNP